MLNYPETQRALKESEERFQAAIIAVQGILWTNDAKGRMVGPQPGWATLTGQTEEEYQGYGWSKTVHPDDAQPTIDAWQQAVTERSLFIFEHRLRLSNGTWGLFSIRAVPVFETDGSIREWVGVHTNITQQREAEQALIESEERYRLLSIDLDQQVKKRTVELETANQELKTANELLLHSNENLQAFAYVASHDLQEPLRKIQTFSDLLKNQYGLHLGKGIDYLERMQSATSRMSSLIHDLLNFSRFSSQPAAQEQVRLTDIVQQVLTDLDLITEETRAQIQVATLPVVMGAPAQLRHLFQNLISNALKFRRPEVSPAIHIRAGQILSRDLPVSVKPVREAFTYYQIDVIDNGIGFESQYAEKIFQVFQRLHGRSEYTGTGIGLAICKSVVINHGGAITASSQVGQGATFSVYLPQSQ
jgi:PAS domain S-box-containing protein